VGIDEFVYIGDSINDLITALAANTNAILGKTGD
jgi:phosphoglycolate phosphatase-like HAD superfamily hydrolase